MSFGKQVHDYLSKLDRDGAAYEVSFGGASYAVVDHKPDALLVEDSHADRHLINPEQMAIISIHPL